MAERGKRGIPFINGSSYMNSIVERGAEETRTTDDVMTSSSVFNRTATCIIVLLIGVVIGWIAMAQVYTQATSVNVSGVRVPLPVGAALGIISVSMIGTLVFGIVSAVKRNPSRVCILLFCIFEGVMVGSVSMSYNSQYDGIVSQALIATLCVVVASAMLFKTGIVRRHLGTLQKFVLVALVSYILLSIVNMIMVFTGIWGGFGIWSTPLGIGITLFAVLLGGLMLSMDLTHAQIGIEEQVPERYSWMIAFSLTLDVVWIYLEILRLLALFRND
jgi:uncharacterized YccA/Bax inhibitor family protein